MGKTNRNNVRNSNKRRHYSMEEIVCRNCKHYQGKRGCKLDKCCSEDEKLEVILKNKIKQKRRLNLWDM
jgi:hypothetical protein